MTTFLAFAFGALAGVQATLSWVRWVMDRDGIDTGNRSFAQALREWAALRRSERSAP